MTREQFLSSWAPYPAAADGWLDVSAFVRLRATGACAIRSIVGGRLTRAAAARDEWWLESGGEAIAIAGVPDYFASGDLVAVEISSADATVLNVRLLAPALDEPVGSRFTVRRSREWAEFVARIREFFVARDFVEASTPTLVPSPGTEPFLDPFLTTWELGSRRETLYLPTSPEFHLKQMLARGWARIFEFKPCFRNGEIGDHHQPEFTMLEWYRAYSNLEAIAADVEALLRAVAGVGLRRTTIAQLFAEAFGGFQLRPDSSKDELAALAKGSGIATSADDSFDDVFFRLFLERIEPQLGADGPLLVQNYPPGQAALSRIGEHGWAERFEVYWRGLELANAFHELNDPRANEERFATDAATKKTLGRADVPRDENLLRALKTGMPPSGGIALGVDRLFMALHEIGDIADVRAFPLRRGE